MKNNKNIKWLSFKKARQIVRGLGLKSMHEWRRYPYKKLHETKIPLTPEIIYKKEFTTWGDWLDTKNRVGYLERDFLPFKEARKIVRGLKFKSEEEWRRYIDNNSHLLKNLKIPLTPRCIYKKEWDSMGDFIGNGTSVNKKKYCVNENFFKKWSHKMAYVFGLWFADGCIVKKNYFDITLHKNDKYLLEKISKIMKSNYPINKNRNCFRIQLHSETIVSSIIKLGGKYRKSLDCKFPYVPKKYLPDFIRGEFDGDGCVCCGKGKKDYYSSIRSGSKSFSKSLVSTLRKAIPDFKGSIYKSTYKLQSDRMGACYSIMFNANDTRRLRSFIYQHKPKLKMLRKYNLFKKAGEITILSRNKNGQYVGAKKGLGQ